MKNAVAASFVLLIAASAGAVAPAEICARPVLGDDERLAAWGAAYNALFDADAAADDAWRAVGGAAEFESRCRALREKMVWRIGGFPPERTALNAKVTGRIARDGYSVECVVFESRPGAYVTCNMYLPSPGRFPPPHPAAVEFCGHTAKGKNAEYYQRAALLCARNGIAVLVVDPLSQGERGQCEEDASGSATTRHLRLGVNAFLLGHGLAAFMAWDAMRAFDYLDSRSDVRHGGYGSFGNSGGGTQSVMASALDGRVKATATCCYLSNLREQTAWRLLADSEQYVFGQLADGLNHAAYPLLGGNPVMMLARWDEFIPFTGTRETFRVVSAVAKTLGREGWYSMYDIPGPHGYGERNVRATASFMARRLRGAEADFSGSDGDFGPELGTAFATPTGRVLDVPGFKSAYSYLEDELDAALKARRVLTDDELAEVARRTADVREGRLGAREVVSEEIADGGVRAVRAIYAAADGCRVPAVELVPDGAKGAPVLVVGDGSRAERAGAAETFLRAGRPVMLADVFATGENGASKHHFANPNDDEEIAKMLYLMGTSLVGRRAGDVVALARDLKARHGAAPEVVAFGRTAVAAAHAFAAARRDVARVEAVDAPLSWEASVRTRAYYDYAASVNGALLAYDWVDLMGRARRSARVDTALSKDASKE